VSSPRGRRIGRQLDRLMDAGLPPFARQAEDLSRREVIIAGALLLLLVSAVYGWYVAIGTWTADDWLWIDHYHFMSGSQRSPIDLVAASLDLYPRYQSYRATNNLVLQPLMELIGGEHKAPRMVVGLALTVSESVLLYVVARLAGLRRLHSATAAGLLALLPSVDATRVWFSAYHQTLAASFYLGGLALALAALRCRASRLRLGLHAGAAVGYALAIWTYESFLVLVSLSVLVYLPVAGPRRAVRRWVADLCIAIVLAGVLAQGTIDARGPDFAASHLLNRADQLGTESLDVFKHSLPFGNVLWSPFGIALALLIAAGVALAMRRGDSLSHSARNWVLTAGIAVIFVLGGLLPLLPAASSLAISWSGNDNRLNLAPSLGHVLLLCSLIWLAAIAVGRVTGRSRLVTPVAAVLVFIAAVTFVAQDERNLGSWEKAGGDQTRVLDGIARVLGPDPAPGTGVIAFGFPYDRPDGVRVFYSTDLAFALRVRYDDETLNAAPFRPDQGTGCGADTFSTLGVGADGATLATDVPYPYGNLYFVDFAHPSWERVPDERTCRLALSQARTGRPLPRSF
jgi:hypothetical protein